ncbi:MAG: cysteine--tRNA ligase [Spirochaetota bacterium]
MTVRFYNSLHKQKEDFQPEDKQRVKIYSCGPTVYNYNHIGNFRSYIFVDVLRRSLKLLGYGLQQTMNITDIDDKIIKNSLEKKQTVEEFTAKWTQVFFEDLQTLQIDPVEHYPKATESVDFMTEIMQRLQENGYTYHKDGNLYYSLDKFSEYGSLSKIDVSGMVSGTRYDADEYAKDDIRDFVLWKAPKQEGEKSWQTPFGEGRPGWHLECSAMIRQIYQSGVDIHTGGVDLMFPHHENEIAQSRGAYPDEEFVKYWLHCEHLLVESKKMSKSLGNFYTLRDLVQKGYDPKHIRYLLLSFHYRTKLNFSFTGLEDAKKAVEKIQNTLDRVLSATEYEVSQQLPQNYAKPASDAFLEALADDLNVPVALAGIFDFCRQVNQDLDKNHLSGDELLEITSYYYQINQLLAVLHFEKDVADLAMPAAEIEEWIVKRVQAKKDKNYALADQIRNDLSEKGIILEDSKTGTTWKRK